MKVRYKITVVGSGYVGMSLSMVLSRQNDVSVLDIDSDRVSIINSGKSTILDPDAESFENHTLKNLNATLDKTEAYRDADFVIVATPTDYDESTNQFDTSSVEGVISDVVSLNNDVAIIIKSTVPVGFTERIRSEFDCKEIIFSPEF